MSKKTKGNNRPVYKLGDGSVPAIITEHVTKKGKLKAGSKKEENILRGACVHHTINHKGRLKPTISKDGHQCYCRICRESFTTKPYDESSLNKVVGDMSRLNNQAKFLITAVNGGNESIRYFSELGSMLRMYAKRYGKLLKVARKVGDVKAKKVKKSSGQSTYGSWG